MQFLENISIKDLLPSGVVRQPIKQRCRSKVDHDNMTKKMMKPTKIKKTVKSSRIGIDRSMAAQIEAQDGGDAVDKKSNRDAVQKKCNRGAVHKKRIKDAVHKKRIKDAVHKKHDDLKSLGR